MAETMIHEAHAQALPGFFGPSNALFGWYHRPAAASPQRLPVLLCNPIGFEQVRVHKTIRALAITLASNGHPVLRFDYRTTGDSLDAPWNQGQVGNWLDDIRIAIKHLQALAGGQDFSILGIRMGATFASLLADECRPASAVLWEPIAAGKVFVREMQILESGYKFAARDQDDPGINAGGFYFNQSTIDELDQIELLTDVIHLSMPVLVVERDDLPPNRLRTATILGRHDSAEFARLPGYKTMMLAPQLSTIPNTAIREIVDWLAAKHKQPAQQSIGGTEDSTTSNIHCESTIERESGFGELAFRFGPRDKLFGILSHPQKPDSRARPPVILLCGGAVPHYSANRMYTVLARRLATIGHSVVRMDLSGIGDSDSLADGVRDRAYFAAAGDDVSAAMDVVAEHTGQRRCILVGLCSGAFVALNAAKESSRIIHTVLVNQLVYYVSPTEYKDLLNGKIKSGHELDFPRMTGTHRKLIIGALQTLGLTGQRFGTLLQRYLIGGRLSFDLDRLARQGTRLSFIHSEQDPAQHALLLPAGLKIRKLSKLGMADYQVVPETDHIFSSPKSQNALIERVLLCLQDESGPR